MPWQISRDVGVAIKLVDAATPGPHVRTLYDKRPKKNAKKLAQLRTGASRLNQYLHRIGVNDSANCSCGAAEETIKHFMFTCILWQEERKAMTKRWTHKCGDLSFFLGGRGPYRSITEG